MDQEDLGEAFAEFATESLEMAEAYFTAFPKGIVEYEEDEPPDPPRAGWRIWSNIEKQWFRRQARGYTPRIEESGRFMPMEALQIYQHAARGWDPQSNAFTISITLVPV